MEVGAAKLGAVLARRRARRAARPRRGVMAFVGEVFGTLAALACFVTAAFTVGFVLGMTVAGLALLVLDFKIALVRRARTTHRRSP